MKDPKDIIIFGRAIAMSYQEGRDDATVADKRRYPSREIYSRYIRVHSAEFIAGSLENGVSLSELMDELQSDAFASTQRNAAQGSGNTDPRKSYNQQAAVVLSDEGYEWLNYKLDAAFRLHGRIPPNVMKQLYWPQMSPSPNSGKKGKL